MFRLEINDPTEAQALISQNLVCQVTVIVYRVEEFRSPVSVKQCYNCQSFGHSAKTCISKQKCLICRENHSHKGCPIEKQKKNNKKQQNVLIVTGHMLHLTKGVRNTKSRHSGNMWLTTKKFIPQLSAKTLPSSPKPQMRHFLSLPNSSLNS